MTLEERVRRIERYIDAASRQDGWLAILDEIRASLDAPCDEPAGARHYCAKHAVGSAYGCGACKGERIAALEAERDSLRDQRDAEQRRAMAAESERDVLREEHTAQVLENADLARERDEARTAFHSQVDKHAAVCGELAQCQRALAQVERERDSLRAQLADAHRVLAQGETIDAATERDTREKMERLERGVREAARLAERVLADRVAAFDSQLRLYPETYCRDDAQEHEEAKAKLAALRAALEGP